MYKEVFVRLSRAKNNGQKDSIRDALLFFVTQIKNILNLSTEKQKKLPFSEFIEDNSFIFGTHNKSVFNKEEADLEISTEGLVTELLNTSNIPNGKELADNLKKAIFAVHSNFSKGIFDNKPEIDKLFSVLKEIENNIYQ